MHSACRAAATAGGADREADDDDNDASQTQALPADWRDFLALTKPRVMTLVVFTGLCGLLVAPAPIHPVLGFTAILCIALGAGAAAALNIWYEADHRRADEAHRRAGRCRPGGWTARPRSISASASSFFSVLLMGVATNWFAAAILAVSILFYVFVYTIWLKRRTPQNIVIGGAAGAFPPLIGWAAATGDVATAAAAPVRPDLPVDAAAFLGAVAVRPLRLCQRRRADAAGRRRRPGDPRSRSCSTRCRWRRPRSRPGRSASPAPLYGVAAAALEPRLPAAVAARARQPGDRAGGDEARKAAVRFSILYLFAIFGALVADRWLLA